MKFTGTAAKASLGVRRGLIALCLFVTCVSFGCGHRALYEAQVNQVTLDECILKYGPPLQRTETKEYIVCRWPFVVPEGPVLNTVFDPIPHFAVGYFSKKDEVLRRWKFYIQRRPG